MRRLFLRFTNLFRRGRAEREMSREIEAHLALLQEEFERQGMSVEEANLAARRAYGGVEQTKELHREARSFLWVEQFFKDLRYGWSNLRRSPGFTLTAAIALTLGIGVNATVFGLYDAVAMKQLPVADPSHVVRVKRWFADRPAEDHFAFPEYEYLRDYSTALSAVIAEKSQITVLAEVGSAQQRVSGYAVSANYFSDLGVKLRLGRGFLPDEDRVPNANPVIVLDYRFWQSQFSSALDVIGRTLKLNGLEYTIVGVAPREFTGTDAFPVATAFWAPLSMVGRLTTFSPDWRKSTSEKKLQLLVRLKEGVSMPQAQAETTLRLRQYLAGLPEPVRNTGVILRRASFLDVADSPEFAGLGWALLIVVCLVLLVACANVANMLLARGAGRQREIGIRLALGASRGRIIPQLLVESALLSILGASAGVLVSLWSGKLLWTAWMGIFQGFHVQFADPDLAPDARVLLYGLALWLLVTLLSGLLPALQSTLPNLTAAIKSDQFVFGRKFGRSRLRGLFIGTQVAVSVLLLVVVFGLTSGVLDSRSSDPGFETRNTYVLILEGGRAENQRLRDRLQSLPELSAAAIGSVPLNTAQPPPPMQAGGLNRPALTTYASDRYFETLGIRLLQGRGFTRQEAEKQAPVAVISKSTAGHFWPGDNPLGKRFSLDLNSQSKFTAFEVVGIAADARFADLTEVDALHVYLPSAEGPNTGILFRVRANRGQSLAAARSAVQSVDPSLLPGLDMISLEDGFVSTQRRLLGVMASLAGVATLLSLILAGVGIYGVLAFLVARRTKEIGIRVALGARSRALLWAIVIQGLRPVLAGMAIGFVLGAGVNVVDRATDPFPAPLYQSVFGDPSIYEGLALMLVIAVLACVIPTRRALRVDPAVALRYE
jgi:predicted permease